MCASGGQKSKLGFFLGHYLSFFRYNLSLNPAVSDSLRVAGQEKPRTLLSLGLPSTGIGGCTYHHAQLVFGPWESELRSSHLCRSDFSDCVASCTPKVMCVRVCIGGETQGLDKFGSHVLLLSYIPWRYISWIVHMLRKKVTCTGNCLCIRIKMLV